MFLGALPKKMAQLQGQPYCLHRAGAGWVRGEAHRTVHLSKGTSGWVAGSNSRDEREEVGAENFGISVLDSLKGETQEAIWEPP